ncbi:hypothetical protein [Halodesulfovibrio aestuarii]|uniref:Uncharacterized protein n=1 Tax=Halodesulfovibrio aestuarii TaxID=126333 RepID=A0ABV4JTZ7_9BACT
MKKRKTVAEKLLERLRAHPELAARMNLKKAEVIRTYCGKKDYESGAWSWMIYPDGSVGSSDTMTDCVKCDRLKCHNSCHGTIEISAVFDEK